MSKKNGKAGKVSAAASAKKATKAESAGREGSLAAIIDPLLNGQHTVKEIAAELAKKAGEAAKGKDLQANVRARLISYKRKGWQVEKDDEKRVKIIQRG
ncbi:MAG: hypothetical protein HY611_03575 [Elusimicrobia bacterium]|nr:hypothetical protein [Elusimicrobiota bacterium]